MMCTLRKTHLIARHWLPSRHLRINRRQGLDGGDRCLWSQRTRQAGKDCDKTPATHKLHARMEPAASHPQPSSSGELPARSRAHRGLRPAGAGPTGTEFTDGGQRGGGWVLGLWGQASSRCSTPAQFPPSLSPMETPWASALQGTSHHGLTPARSQPHCWHPQAAVRL